MAEIPSVGLRDLARSYGIQVEYVDMSGRTEYAPSGSLLAVLRALGSDVASERDVEAALAERKRVLSDRRVEPVLLAWDGARPLVELRLPSELARSVVRCRLEGEAGGVAEWSAAVEGVPGEWEGYVSARVEPGMVLETGYHHLTLEFADGRSARSMIVAAPSRAYSGPDVGEKRTWGLFCPLYALHREGSWGAGDFSDLDALIDWTSSLGGGLVASLPMLASNFDGPSPIISPYSPTSRIFWNEFYLDLTRIPEYLHSEAAKALVASDETGLEVAELRGSSLVDYGRQMRLKRRVLEILAEGLDASESRLAAFHAYVAEHPEVEDYATFQAAGEEHGRDWRSWPEGLGRGDVDPVAYRYHLYAQWQAHEQLKALSSKVRDEGLTWYLDFPIGVDFNSFDVRAHRHAFATGASVGCPPDPVFTKGQHWGFPPLHPERHRESGYAYLIASIRAHLKYANALRIDHVMGLHRLFWIPQGAEPKDGAFVSTPSEEIYAILSVESHRHSAWLVGEDLGTVPPEVEGAMSRHAVRGMYVIQYELRPDPDKPLREPPPSSVASVNTHDMPPFGAFWGGLDLDDRKDLGLLDDETLPRERAVRAEQRSAVEGFLRDQGDLDSNAEDPRSVLHAVWRWLARSPSRVLLLNIEDLWLETESQNTPNTYLERPNWRRKLRRPLEQIAEDLDCLDILRQVDELRSRPARATDDEESNT